MSDLQQKELSVLTLLLLILLHCPPLVYYAKAGASLALPATPKTCLASYYNPSFARMRLKNVRASSCYDAAMKRALHSYRLLPTLCPFSAPMTVFPTILASLVHRGRYLTPIAKGWVVSMLFVRLWMPSRYLEKAAERSSGILD